MEALTSANALDEAINEGSYQTYRKLPKASLPHTNKKHIFEGMDTSFIDRDILKVKLPCSAAQSSVSQYMRQYPDKPPSARVRNHSVPKPTETVFKPNAKYRHFVKNNSNTAKFGRLPALAQRSLEIPTNYNSFFSTDFEQERLQVNEGAENGLKSADKIIRCSEELKRQSLTPENKYTCPTIERLMIHIEDVKRMMGKEHSPRQAPKRKKARVGFSQTCGSSTRPTTSESQLRGMRFSRHKTTSEIQFVGDVLGFGNLSRDRTRTRLSTTQPTLNSLGIRHTQPAPLAIGTKQPASLAMRIEGNAKIPMINIGIL